MANASLLGLVARLVVSLGVVLGLMAGAAWVVRRRGGSVGRPRGGATEVLARQTLTRTSSVQVVRIGERTLVLGVTEQQVSYLTEIDADEIAMAQRPEPNGTGRGSNGSARTERTERGSQDFDSVEFDSVDRDRVTIDVRNRQSAGVKLGTSLGAALGARNTTRASKPSKPTRASKPTKATGTNRMAKTTGATGVKVSMADLVDVGLLNDGSGAEWTVPPGSGVRSGSAWTGVLETLRDKTSRP